MKIDKLVPRVYYEESRDFAYMGRVLEIIANYTKSLADVININYNSDYIDSNIVNLNALSLGLSNINSYDIEELKLWSSNFSSIVKYKGSLKSIELAIKLWLNYHKADVYNISLAINDYTISIGLPLNVGSTKLLEYMFNYLLPAGINYNIYSVTSTKTYSSSFNKCTESNNKSDLTSQALGQISDNTNNNINISDPNFSSSSVFYFGNVVDSIDNNDSTTSEVDM